MMSYGCQRPEQPTSDSGGQGTFPDKFLDLLTDSQRTALLGLGSNRVYDKNQPLMREGHASDAVIVILRGLAKIVVVSEGGKEILLGFRGIGELIGEMAALSGRPRSATVIAATELQGCVIRAASFISYIERTPPVATRVSDIMADKLRASNRRRLEFNAYPAESRVSRVLVEIALRHGHREASGWRIGPEITQADIASLASTSVRTIEKVLRALDAAGLVARHRRDLIVTDADALERHCRSLLRNPH